MCVAEAMVGRASELARLRVARDSLDAHGARCAAVIGEAGIGKTRLLDEFARDAQGRDPLVLRGRAEEFEQQVPFALMIDALDEHLTRVDPSVLDRFGEARRAELAPVFPSLAPAGLAPAATPAERYRCHYAVRALLEELSRDTPLVLALDDAHWADEASVELLAHLLGRGLRGAVLLVLAYRPRSAPMLLAKAVESAVREERADLLELQPLTPAEGDRLLGEDLDPATRSLLFAESGGNPFYLEQLARAPVIDNPVGLRLLGNSEDAGPAIVPVAVCASIAQELDSLSPRARILLEGAAVLGEPFEPEVVADVTGLHEADALEALDELIGIGLVHRTDTPRRFAFRHPIVCRAVYESCGEGWRLTAHARAAAALIARGEPALVVALHAERSAKVGDEVATQVLTQAGHAAANHAPNTAARFFHAALRLLPGDHDADEARLELLIASAVALSNTGRLTESRHALSDALALVPASEEQRRVRVVGLLAQTEAFLGRDGEARAILQEALGSLGPDRRLQRATLTLELAVDHARSGARDDAAARAGDALAEGVRSGDRALRGAAGAFLAWVEYARGDIASSRRHAREAAGVVDAMANRELASNLMAIFHLANTELGLGDFEAAMRHGERGLAIARATGQALVTIPLSLTVGWAELGLGRLAMAERSAERVLDAARLLGIEQYLSWAWCFVSWVATQRGNVTEAVAAGERSVAFGGAAPRGLLPYLGHCVLGEAFIASGHHQRGIDEILDNAGGSELVRVSAGARAGWYELLVEAELLRGRPDAAHAWAKRAEENGTRCAIAVQRAFSQRAVAAWALADGRPKEAADAARTAARILAELGLPAEHGRAMVLVGRALGAADDHEGAVEALELAYRELDACGALRRRDEAAQELRRLSQRVPRRGRRGSSDRQGVEALSGREREVAALVAQGRTNKQIGAALYLSERTIENHVSHIFGKLGVSSRTQIAREIGRAGALQTS